MTKATFLLASNPYNTMKTGCGKDELTSKALSMALAACAPFSARRANRCGTLSLR